MHDRTCTSCEVTRALITAQTSERRPRPIFIQAYECVVFVCVCERACACACVLQGIPVFKWVKVRLASYYCLHSGSYIIAVNCTADGEGEADGSGPGGGKEEEMLREK